VDEDSRRGAEIAVSSLLAFSIDASWQKVQDSRKERLVLAALSDEFRDNGEGSFKPARRSDPTPRASPNWRNWSPRIRTAPPSWFLRLRWNPWCPAWWGWPATERTRSLYLRAGGRLDFTQPQSGEPPTEYVSDPAKPVPQAPRPFLGVNYDDEQTIAEWRRWLTEDQRFVDGRPDVATWVSAPLERDLALRGAAVAKLYAATTGTDADWVVKLIDVYPDQDAERAERGGLEVVIAADIFRGRYRESFTEPRALAPDKVLEYRIPLPHANHVFRRGHRLMVQIQSSWFPLYDRNPQTFVPSIMTAPPESYRAQRHRVHHEAGFATRLELPLSAP
jgi:putative CocE/NonD family hydrolase